ncbi:MAG: glutamine--fructose-6-phosphate aminotransferase, partial [Planctomycetota bacterium]
MEGLRRLEYRGYDSAGLAVENGRGLDVVKLSGQVNALVDRVRQSSVPGTCGIAHTRWATHGAPTSRNAHPHTDCSNGVAVVHNGIVENADSLRTRLERAGHQLTTDTDTEVLAHLVEDAGGSSLEERVIEALQQVEGAYGVAVMSEDDPGKIVVARKGSPVLIGLGNGEFFVASDASALLEHTRSVVYLDEGDIAVLTTEGYRIIDQAAREQIRS